MLSFYAPLSLIGDRGQDAGQNRKKGAVFWPRSEDGCHDFHGEIEYRGIDYRNCDNRAVRSERTRRVSQIARTNLVLAACLPKLSMNRARLGIG